MPIYEYKCRRCEIEFEVFYTSMNAVKNEEPDEKCPKCDSTKKDRLVSKHTGFILTGNGWAKDGYSGGGKKK